MTENEAIKRIKECRNTPNFQPYIYMNEALNMAIHALEKQEKIKEVFTHYVFSGNEFDVFNDCISALSDIKAILKEE